MRRLVAVLTGLLMGLVLVVANAGGASASPTLTVTTVSLRGGESPYGCCGGNDAYLVEASGTATFLGTINAGGHTFIGSATMSDFGVFGTIDCNGQAQPLERCTGAGISAGGTISGAGVGSIYGTCVTRSGTFLQQAIVLQELVSQTTLPLTCSISFNGGASQSVSFTVVLVWTIPLAATTTLGVGIAVG